MTLFFDTFRFLLTWSNKVFRAAVRTCEVWRCRRHIAQWLELFCLKFTRGIIKITLSWNTCKASRNLTERYGCFWATCCLYLQGRRRKSYVTPRSWYRSSKLRVFRNRTSVILNRKWRLQTYSSKTCSECTLYWLKSVFHVICLSLCLTRPL